MVGWGCLSRGDLTTGALSCLDLDLTLDWHIEGAAAALGATVAAMGV